MNPRTKKVDMKKLFSIAFLFVAFATMISCDSIQPNKISEMAGLEQAESILSTPEYIDLDYLKVEISSEDQLNENFEFLNVDYFDKKVEKVIEQFYGGGYAGFSDPKAKKIQPKKYETFKVSEIDFSFINQKTNEGKQMVADKYSSEYEDFTLSVIRVKKENGKLKTTFDVNMVTIGGGGGSRQGQMVTTVYYSINCTIEDDGSITLKES